jgi:hypothetical protein
VLSRRERLSSALYGGVAAPTLSGWARVWFLVGLVIVGSFLALIRTPREHWNILWAEDGIVFIPQALGEGVGSVLRPYAGYMHLVPRLAALALARTPIEVLPLAVTIASAVATALIACATYVFLETRLVSFPLRVAAWLVMIALPIAAGEVANNLANLHWYLMISAFCALIVRTRSTGVAVAQSMIAVAAVASDPLTLLFLPLAVLRFWLLPTPRDRAVVWSFCVAGAAQVMVVALAVLEGTGREASDGSPSAPQLLNFYSVRVVLTALLGPTRVLYRADDWSPAVGGLALAAVIGVLVLAAVWDASRRWAILALAAGSLGFAAVVFVLQWDALIGGGLFLISSGERYAVVPAALLLFALLFSGDALVDRARTPWVRSAIAIAGLIIVLVPMVYDFRWEEIRADAPTWDSGLRNARAVCAEGAESAEVPIAPDWFVDMPVPCELLTGDD